MNNHAPILLAEDDENDALLMRVALQKAGVSRPLIVARDGQETVDYLEGRGPYADRGRFPLPALLLLDLKMPRMNGFDVLAWLQGRPELALPVVVLSSSEVAADIEKARLLGADDYHVKPQEFADLLKIILELKGRWLADKTVS